MAFTVFFMEDFFCYQWRCHFMPLKTRFLILERISGSQAVEVCASQSLLNNPIYYLKRNKY